MLPFISIIVSFEPICLGRANAPTSTVSVSPIRRSATAKLITRKLVRFNLLLWTQKTNTVKALEIQTMIEREARRIKTAMEAVSPDISTYKLSDLLENILYIAQ